MKIKEMQDYAKAPCWTTPGQLENTQGKNKRSANRTEKAQLTEDQTQLSVWGNCARTAKHIEKSLY